MNRRFGAVAIVLVALTALAGVLSFVFFSQPVPKNSATATTPATDASSSTSSSSEIINPDPSEPLPVPNSLPLVVAAPRADQPANLKPQPPARSPDWKLLDWSLKTLPEKPGIQLRASSYLASGKYPFVRIEEEIQIIPNGEVKVLRTAEMVGDQIIVKLPEGSAAEEIQSLALKLGGQAATKPFAPDTWLVALPRKLESVPEALVGSTNSGISIDYAEPSFLVRPLRTPNDPRFNDFTLWHLYNYSRNGADIGAPQAWDRRFTGNHGTNLTNKVVVAVIDSGVRLTHQDLSSNIWINTREQGGNPLKDDDRNGYFNDINGWDFYGNDANPSPGSPSVAADGHGTHCSGIIAATGNNGVGTVGVAWSGVQIMALRFINNNSGAIPDAIEAMNYAKDNGARVINASYGMSSFSQSEADAIAGLEQAGVIMVAASGNNGGNNDTNPFYPASHSNNCVISVGGTTVSTSPKTPDDKDSIWNSSNYGQFSVDLMAPADGIYSTRHANDADYGSGSGTSYAAPIVSAAVALRLAEFPNELFADTIAFFRSTNAVDLLPSLAGKCVTGGRLNLSKVLGPADVNTLPQAHVWHQPDHLEGRIPSRMRIPATITLSNDVTIYSGLRKFNNTNGINTNGLVNQTGGWLFYRTSSAVAWTSNALGWHTNNGDFQFWKATIPNVPARTFEYYLQLDFDSGARTTYSYFVNNTEGFGTTTNQATAQASPYPFTVPKVATTVTLAPTASPLRLGQTLASSTLSGGTASVAGDFNFTSPGTAPGLGTSSQAVTFTPTDAANYLTAATSALVTVGGVENPTADTDGDGVPNLLEHALAEISASPTTSSLLGQITTQSTGGSGSNQTSLSLNVIVRTNDTNLLIYPEATLDLGSSTNWTTSGFTTNLPDQTGVPPGFQRREYQFNAGTNPRAFLKLNIQQR